MDKQIKRIIAACMLLMPAIVVGQGYQVYLQGQVQQGMGGAGIAFMQDASALFYNPGGASFVPGNSVQVGGSGVISNVRFLDAGTNQAYVTKSPMGTPFAAYAQFEVKDSSELKLGLAIYTPFGSTIKWEDNWAGRFALTQIKLSAIFFQPTVSYKINDKIGIGAGFVYAIGSVNLQKDIPVADASGNFGHAELNGKSSGIGFNAGIYFKPIEKFSIGLTYRSQVNMDVKNGDATFTVPTSLKANFPDGNFTASLPLPQIASLGLAYKVNEKLDLAFDVNYTVWSAYDTLKFDYETNTVSLADTKSARMYENTFGFRLGAQYKVTDKLAARLGIAYAMTPVQDGYVTPETPDANRISYTAGLGYHVSKSFGVNASFQFISYQRDRNRNLETDLDGTYKTIACIPGISLFYNF